jgi:hypothetical protein
MKPVPGFVRLAGLLLFAGCAVVRPVPREALAIADLRPGRGILVYPDTGRSFQMRYEEIRNDTLFGTTPQRNVRIPLARIDSLFELQPSRGRTTGAIFAFAGVAAGAIMAIAIYGYLHPGY